MTPAQAARMMRDAAPVLRQAMRDRSYRASPIGEEVGRYMRGRRRNLTSDSARDYESCLHKLAIHFADLQLKDLEPPVGRERLEEFLEHQWGKRAPRTFNKALSVMRSFFRWQQAAGRMYGDPTVGVEPAKKQGVYRTTFSPAQVATILVENPELRDKVALRLLLHYGLRRGALGKVQYKHFDHARKTLTIFTKGQKVQVVRIPERGLWHDLGMLLIQQSAEPGHYLMARRKKVANGRYWRTWPDQPMGHHGLHSWWYGCLAQAGIVAEGTTSGERMHKARHSAGQALLDHTHNLKAVQKLLGHAHASTTADVYTDWEDWQLEADLAGLYGDDG